MKDKLKKFLVDHKEEIVVGVLTAVVVGAIGYKINKGNKLVYFEIYPQNSEIKDGFMKIDTPILGVGKKANGKYIHVDLLPNPDFPALIEKAVPDEIYKMASTEN